MNFNCRFDTQGKPFCFALIRNDYSYADLCFCLNSQAVLLLGDVTLPVHLNSADVQFAAPVASIDDVGDPITTVEFRGSCSLDVGSQLSQLPADAELDVDLLISLVSGDMLEEDVDWEFVESDTLRLS